MVTRNPPGQQHRRRQAIDVYLSPQRDGSAVRRFFDRALATAVAAPVEVVTD
jgi:transposase-like protein